MSKTKNISDYLLIAFLGAIFFLPYLGSTHLFDWDELNFAEAAREMLVTNDFMHVRIDYEPFHEKPPLFFWLQAGAMKIFGVGEFAARLPNAICGIASMLILFAVGKKLYDRRFGFLWVLAYVGSLLPHFYFKSGIIDPVFNFFIFLSIYFLSRYFYFKIEKPDAKSFAFCLYSALFAALAVMTKGPVGWLLAFLTALLFWFFNRKKIKFPFLGLAVFSLIAGAPAVAWYAKDFSAGGGALLVEFVEYQIRLATTPDAGHGGPFFYHFLALLIGVFPASILAIRAFRKRESDNSEQKQFKSHMIALLCAVLVVFSIVETKILHYSSLAYFPLTFLAAYVMRHIAFGNMRWKISTSWLLAIFGAIWAALFIGIPIVMANVELITPSVKDEFTRAVLLADVPWSVFDAIPGLLYLGAAIFSIILLQKGDFVKGFMTLFSSTAIIMSAFLILIAPKIEYHMQGAAVEFYQSMQGNGCYVQPLKIGNYKYGHLFYTRKPPELSAQYNPNIPKENYEEWLLQGEIDRPVFFLTKNTKADKYLKNLDIIKLYEKNGIVFMVRRPPAYTETR